MKTTQERVIEIFEQNSDTKVGSNLTATVEELGMDSLDQLELVMQIEDEFSMEIPDEDAAGLQTVQAFVDYIEKHKD